MVIQGIDDEPVDPKIFKHNNEGMEVQAKK